MRLASGAEPEQSFAPRKDRGGDVSTGRGPVPSTILDQIAGMDKAF